MKKVLVDTSVWIDAFNGKKNQHTHALSQLIDDGAVVLCPPGIQEILQGIKNDSDFRQVKENLSGFEVLALDPVEAAYGAAALYRSIRRKGITIRKSNDCLIAFYAICCKAFLLHNDGDFDEIARFSLLDIVNVRSVT